MEQDTRKISHSDDLAPPGKSLPSWCNVYAGLADEEISSLEKIVLKRANLTRSTE